MLKHALMDQPWIGAGILYALAIVVMGFAVRRMRAEAAERARYFAPRSRWLDIDGETE